MIKKIFFALVLAALAGGGYWLWHEHHQKVTSDNASRAAGSRRGAQAGGANAAIPVDIGTVVQRDVPIYLIGIGTVQAFNSVAVTSRVDGQLQKLTFTEGQDVKAGDILALIDPRPFQATLDQNTAALHKDQALLANAKLDLQRDLTLVHKAFASQQTVDTQQSLVQQYAAQVASDQAQIDAARVQLAYCTITSPIAGRTGIRNVDAGNVIHANDSTGIVTVTQIHPISVVFTLPADSLPQIAAGQAQAPLQAAAMAKDGKKVIELGSLAVFDNAIDQTTGTIKLKATFPNADSKLWPGQFVNVRLLVATRKAVPVVPGQVSQVGPSGSFAWVVDENNTVKMQDITTSPADQGDVIVETGLTAGQRVIVDGQYRLQEGSKVVQQAPAPGAAKSAGDAVPGAEAAGSSTGKAAAREHNGEGHHKRKKPESDNGAVAPPADGAPSSGTGAGAK